MNLLKQLNEQALLREAGITGNTRAALADIDDAGKFARKANLWTELDDEQTTSSEDLKKVNLNLKDLTHYDMKTLYGDDNAQPGNDFKIAVPHAFVLTNKHGQFLINTEGYGYARYVTKLI